MIQAGHPLFEAWQRLGYHARRSNQAVELMHELQLVEDWIVRNSRPAPSPEEAPRSDPEPAPRGRRAALRPASEARVTDED